MLIMPDQIYANTLENTSKTVYTTKLNIKKKLGMPKILLGYNNGPIYYLRPDFSNMF